MRAQNLLGSKLMVPKAGTDIRIRPEVRDKLEKIPAYPVTVVQAGAGYGKTTVVAQTLANLPVSFCWYSPGPEDSSTFVFSGYLAAALDTLLPGLKESFAGELSGLEVASWEKILVSLLSCLERIERNTGILVLDDWHLLSREKEIGHFLDRFLACKPAWLNVVILSREKVTIPEVCRLGSRGRRLLIEERDLAFSPQEVYDYLLQVHRCPLTGEDARRIYQYSEGWVMALKLIGRGIKDGSVSLSLENLENNSLDALFDFLALEVLEQQDAGLQSFLLKSSVLDYLSDNACAAVAGAGFEPRLIQEAIEKGLFLNELEDGFFRYHYLFRNFLRREAKKRLPDWEAIHCRAGYHYLNEGRKEEAVHHLICGRQWADAARVLSSLSIGLVNSGRGQFLRHYLQKLPPELQTRGEFLVALGDAERLASNYQAALGLYRQAREKFAAAGERLGLGRALRGMGEIYVDTIQPEPAGKYLRLAHKALGEDHAEEKAKILNLMAENMINLGRPQQAKRYQQLAGEMLHMASRGNFEARLLLRTGRLEAAIRLLESGVPQERGGYHPPVSFRETPLLLSLCHSFVGEAEKAVVSAEEGIRLGQKLKSPFVEAVGYTRLGHALLVREGRPTGTCREAYRAAMELNDRLGVIRGRTEALMGQCLVHGLSGDWLAARRCGLEGIRVTEQARDRWFTAVLYHCLGIAAVSCQLFEEAKNHLARAGELFSLCGDSFGKAVAAWWSSYIALKEGRQDEFCRHVAQLLELCEGRGYDFLVQRGTLLGARDGRASVPLLLEARRQNVCRIYVDWQLQKLGVKDHIPCIGYTLRVQTLGRFRAWRGEEEIELTEWRRESARCLFLLLLTKRRLFLHKEEIMDCLWPEANPDAAVRDFKVALNTLLNVLEPDRQPRSPSFFIQREGPAYYFNLASGFWLDAEEFEGLVSRAEDVAADRPDQSETLLKRALELYGGNYLQGVCQDEWCLEERERLDVIYIRAAELLARLLARRGDYPNCIEWADSILKKDNCWEEAYRLKMICYGRLNNGTMVTRTYQKCVQVLKEELGVVPSARTSSLYKKLVKKIMAY